MKPRTLLALPLVAALAGLGQPLAQAAAATPGEPRGVAPSWDRLLPSQPGKGCPNGSPRFTCVMNDAAFRDNETGLVWGQPKPSLSYWRTAKFACANDATGGRIGWRLPTLAELSTLVDPLNTGAQRLPPGHPFTNVDPKHGYWTETTEGLDHPRIGSYANVWVVRFRDAAPNDGEAASVTTMSKEEMGGAWCVRAIESPRGT